jgi:hypothetical protein
VRHYPATDVVASLRRSRQARKNSGWFCLGVLLLVAARPAEASECEDDPAVVASCFTVHGRVARYVDATIFLWPVGTKRLLDVAYPRRWEHGWSDPFMPARLRALIDAEAKVFGDFKVCPFEPEQPGAARHVCIQSASHLVVRQSSH